METIRQWRRAWIGVLAAAAALSMTACSSGLGDLKNQAANEIAQMSGLSQPMKDEATWRIDSANEKETVERYLAQVRDENGRVLTEDAARADVVSSWIDAALVVVGATGVEGLDGERLELVSDGTITMTPGLAQVVDATTWERIDQPLEDVRLCRGTNCLWHLRALPDNAEYEVVLLRGFSGGPAIHLDVVISDES